MMATNLERGFIAVIRHLLHLHRNVAILALSIFALGLGEELWQQFLPQYLTALGASGLIVGLFSSAKDLLDGLYQYPGGWITDRWGRKRALLLFTLTALGGYAVYALAWHWAVTFVGLALVMGWKAGAFPTTFAVIGDALPPEQRALGFSVQSMLVRLPRVIGAPLGGWLIAAQGVTTGVRIAAGITLLVALVVLVVQQRGYREPTVATQTYEGAPVQAIFARMPTALKRLLLAECLVRFGEGIAAAFIVLYVTGVLGYSAPAFGALYALQQTVSLLSYLPSGRLADVTGRRPLIALTFLFFALFPLAVQSAQGLGMLIVAFIIGGAKEMGEPVRKALIVDLSDPTQRGRAVGAYYTVRNLLIVPAGAIGGLLWARAPHLPLLTGSVVGMVGLLVFWLTERRARH